MWGFKFCKLKELTVVTFFLLSVEVLQMKLVLMATGGVFLHGGNSLQQQDTLLLALDNAPSHISVRCACIHSERERERDRVEIMRTDPAGRGRGHLGGKLELDLAELGRLAIGDGLSRGRSA